ncbi:MAG: hypothetical protein ACXADC_17745, partial [Candidatus Thorarchaeota archaeon]
MSSMNSEQVEIATEIVIDESIYEQFKVYTKLHGFAEWGGVCIGYQEGQTFYVRGIVLPPQILQSGVYCEFRKEVFPLVTKAVIRLTVERDSFSHYRSGAWIHTHPGFGTFFSGTDFDSFKYLIQFSPEYLAIVVDPIKDEVLGYNGDVITKIKEVKKKLKDED